MNAAYLEGRFWRGRVWHIFLEKDTGLHANETRPICRAESSARRQALHLSDPLSPLDTKAVADPRSRYCSECRELYAAQQYVAEPQ